MIRWEQKDIDRLLKPTKASSLSEREFQAAVMTIAHQLKWLFYHTHDSIGSQAGFPDLVMVRGKRLIFAELKTEKGKLSMQQLEWTTGLTETAAEVYVWRPSMMDKIIETLK